MGKRSGQNLNVRIHDNSEFQSRGRYLISMEDKQSPIWQPRNGSLIEWLHIKNLLMPLFLMGCFPRAFQDVKRPLRTKSVKRPVKVEKRPINEGKRPIKAAKVLVGVSVGSLMGCFRAPPTWRKTAPLKRPIKRSMNIGPYHIDYFWSSLPLLRCSFLSLQYT